MLPARATATKGLPAIKLIAGLTVLTSAVSGSRGTSQPSATRIRQSTDHRGSGICKNSVTKRFSALLPASFPGYIAQQGEASHPLLRE